MLEKHPEPVVIDESAFLPCDDLPPLLGLDITADYVEHVAHQIQGSAGLVDPQQWHGYLFCYAVPGARLCNGVAMLARHLASGNADCELFYLHSDDSWGFCLLMQEMLLIQLIMCCIMEC